MRERLDAHGASPSKLKDAAMAVAGKGFVLFARSRPDTTGKLTACAHAFEFPGIGGYEQLVRVSRRANENEVVRAVEAILVEERAAARKIAAQFDRAVEASLQATGVAA